MLRAMGRPISHKRAYFSFLEHSAGPLLIIYADQYFKGICLIVAYYAATLGH